MLEKHLKDEAIEIILKHTESKTDEVKIAAIVLLGILRDRRAIRYLVGIADDERFKEAVKDSLNYLARRYPDAIIHYMKEGFPETRRVVAEVIAQLKDPIFYNPLMEALDDTDGHIVSTAAKGLGYIGNKETVEKLLPLLKHPYPDVQDAVVDALYNLREYIEMEKVREMLKDKHEGVRKNIALLIGRCKKTEFVDSIGQLLDDPSVEVRKAAVLAIGMLNTAKATHYLRNVLTDESREIRALATEKIAEIGGSVFAESVILMTKDTDPYVRAAAARALSHFSNETSVQALIELLSDENGYVVTQAVESLAQTGHPDAKKALTELLQNTQDREIKRTILLAISAFESSEELIKPFLLSEDWVLRFSAVKALQRIGTDSARDAVAQLKEIETDLTVLEAIREVLGG
jgi:HEAT repeat protein